MAKSLLDCRSGRFYDPWESEREEARSQVISQKLEDYVQFAREHVPFYADRLKAYENCAPYPLWRVPVLKSEDLRELLPPRTEKLLNGHGESYSVFQSGGTTGNPKTTLFSHKELEDLTLPNARGFYAVGLNRQDRVANLFAVGGLYMTFLHINRMLQEYGCMNFPFSNHTPSDFIHTVVRLFKINCIAGISSPVMSCLRDMAQLGLEGIRVTKVFYGGEHLYEADKKEIRERFGVHVVAAPGYGTVDTWYLGYQCLLCGGGVFHAHDDQCYLEIVHEETGAHTRPGEAGMLYATPFLRRLTPIVRYRVGDRAMWLKEICPCGRTTPLFKLLGRGDDVLRIGYDSIDYVYVQDTVLRVPGLSGTVQMEKQRESGKDRLIIRVETEVPPSRYPELAQALEREIVAHRICLRDLLSKGDVWPLRCEFFSPGKLPRNPRTGKLIRVMDSVE